MTTSSVRFFLTATVIGLSLEIPSMNPVELTRLVAAVRSATAAVDAAHDDAGRCIDIDAAEGAIRVERRARDALTSWMIDTFESEPVAVVMADGTLVCYGDTSDNLLVIDRENIHRLA
jgi:hypothetical protein